MYAWTRSHLCVGISCVCIGVRVMCGNWYLNPRPGGGLSHLRHGGGQNDPRLTRKLGKLEDRAIRRCKDLSEPIRSHFVHFFRSGEYCGQQRSSKVKFGKNYGLSGMSAIISGTIIATTNLEKAEDNPWHAPVTLFHQIWRKGNTLASRGHGR